MKKTVWQYQGLARPTFVPETAETVTVDKWFFQSPPPVWPEVPCQECELFQPLHTAAGDSIPPNAQWLYQEVTPTGKPAPAALIDARFSTPHVEPPPAEIVTVDKWYQPAQVPLHRHRSAAEIPGSQHAIHEILPPPAVVNIDKWYRETERPVFFRPWFQELFACGVFTAAPMAQSHRPRTFDQIQLAAVAAETYEDAQAWLAASGGRRKRYGVPEVHAPQARYRR